MTVQKRIVHGLVFGLFLLSAGGAVIHYLVHPVSKGPYGYVPMLVGILGLFVIPWLFYFKKTLHLAYILNGFSVIVGTVTMAHYALVSRPIWPDLLILWPKFFMGYALFHFQSFPATTDYSPGWKTIRYPHFGFWVWHLLSISTVYALGHFLWSL